MLSTLFVWPLSFSSTSQLSRELSHLGGLYGDKTNHLIGVSETLIATALAGCLFALVAGQPLIIVGATGPVLLFDESFYAVSLCLVSSLSTSILYISVNLFLDTK